MKIFDCFTFYNELEVLDIRLNMLNDVVDYFVLVEIPKTHLGKDKNKIFDENRNLFEKFLDKIIYVTAENIPETKGYGDWTIENFQRNLIFSGLNGKCDYDDIIMVSDLDEIPNPRIIREIKNTEFIVSQNSGFGKTRQIAKLYSLFGWKRFLSTVILRKHRNINDLLEFSPVALQQRMFYYYLNLEADHFWSGTVIAKWKQMITPQYMRKNRDKIPYVKNGGWHFSYMGGAEKVMNKLNSIVEGHVCNTVEEANDGIEKCISSGKEILVHRGKEEYRLIDRKDLMLEDVILKYIEQKYPFFFR